MPRGLTLLSYLYDAAQAVDLSSNDKPLRSLLLTLLSYASWPFFRWLDAWLGVSNYTCGAQAVLVDPKEIDPYSEFIIIHAVDDTELAQNGDAFWDTVGWVTVVCSV